MSLTVVAKAVRYRVEQFMRALTARHAIPERRIKRAVETLPPGARVLFVQQPVHDQRHALAVYETLLEQGHTNEDLLTAALLHDVGKSAAQASPWQRGFFVLAKRFVPWLLDQGDQPVRALQGEPGNPGGPLVTYGKHPEIGARWAREAGCSALTVELIRLHERQFEACRTKRDRLLAALQAADDVS